MTLRKCHHLFSDFFRDLVAGTDQTEVLALGNLKGGIGHHIQKSDMKFPNVLVPGLVEIENLVAPFAQSVEGGKGKM